MSAILIQASLMTDTGPEHPVATGHLTVSKLDGDCQAEVTAFLAERPSHTFGLAGFIRDNGLVSPHNRGEFYACRDQQGKLEGVALIGHYILFETRSEAAIAAFARVAQGCPDAYVLLGEQEKVQTFWHHYSAGGQELRLRCRELLFELRWPVALRPAVNGLRLATSDDLDLIVPAHAQTVIEESGVNPLEVDSAGFRDRCLRRIEQGRTWVWTEGNKLMFKVEVVTDTPEVMYLEGVWVDPEERGKGYGSRCMSQLGRMFLERTGSVCLLVNDRLKQAQAVYRKAGYRFLSNYDTIFLQSR